MTSGQCGASDLGLDGEVGSGGGGSGDSECRRWSGAEKRGHSYSVWSAWLREGFVLKARVHQKVFEGRQDSPVEGEPQE